MNNKKDYSLLRPFDLEAAKAGEQICSDKNGSARLFIVGRDGTGQCVISNPEESDVWYFADSERLRMAPLAWVEGRPVYKGDVLYYVEDGIYRKFVVQDSNQFGPTAPVFLEDIPNEHGVGRACSPEKLTWQKPKVKKSGWALVGKDSFSWNEDEAKSKASGAKHKNLVAVYGEWEE